MMKPVPGEVPMKMMLVSVLLVRHWLLHAHDLCAATARQAFVGSMCERVCVCVVQCSERSKEDALCGTGCCWTCRCGGTGAGICGTPAGMLAVCI